MASALAGDGVRLEPVAVLDIGAQDLLVREDADGFLPQEYVAFTEEDEARWLAACREFEFFRDKFYDFDYETFYTSLHRVRGALAKRSGSATALAVALMKNPKSYYAIKTL